MCRTTPLPRLPLCFALLLTVLISSPLPGMAQTPPDPALSPSLLARTATLALKVDHYDDARSQALVAAEARHAEIMDAKTLVDPKGKKHGWMRLRLDASQMPALLADLPALGKTYAENVGTTDQRSQFEELGLRVTRLQQHEQRLDGVLQSPRRMRGSDILYLQERLFRASVDESLLSQQRIDLQRSASTSTLLVEMFEPGTLPPGIPQPVNLPTWFERAHAIAQTARSRTLARAATVSAYAAVYAPFWIPVAVVALVLLAMLWRMRRRIGAGIVQIVTVAVTLLMRALGWLRLRWEHRHDPLGLPRFAPPRAE